MKKFNILTKSITLLIALITVFSFTGCATITNPAYYLDDSLNETKDEMLDFDIANILSEALKNGSVKVDVSSDNEMIPFEDINAKFFFDQDASSIVSQLSAKFDSQTLDANLFVSPEDYVVSSESILGDKAYGIALDKASENYPNSIFSDNGSEYYIDMSTDEYNSFIEFCNKYAEFTKTTDSVNDIIDDYKTTLLDCIKEYAVADRYKENGITYVTMSFDNESITSILNELAEKLKNDEDAQKILYDFARLLSVEEKESVEAQLDKFIATEMDDAINDIKTGDAIKIDVKVGTVDKIVKSADVTINYDNTDVLIFNADISDDQNTYSITSDGETYELIYDKIENSNSLYSSKITLKYETDAMTVTLFKADINWNRDTSALEIDANVINDSYTSSNEFMNINIKGSLDVTKNSFTLVVNQITVDEVALADITVTLEVKASDSMPEIPAYQDILLISEDDMNTLVEEISINAMGFSGFLFPDNYDDFDYSGDIPIYY